MTELIPERVAYTQLAEECTELAHAALKLGRFADEKQCYAMGDADRSQWLHRLYEEMADVLVCMDAIMAYQTFGAEDEIEKIRAEKKERWKQRLKGGME